MYIIIPIKPFNQSKTRLSPLLTLDQRIQLSRNLLQCTIHLARHIGQVVVISRDKLGRQLAKQAGAWSLVEAGANLNAAVQQATDWVLARGGQATLILPGDLPLLTLADLEKMVILGQQSPSVVVAPCHRSDGTNGLFLRPPNLIEFAFGPGSFAKHQHAANQIGVTPQIYHSPTIALDLDIPEDLKDLDFEVSQNEASLNCD